MRTFKLFAVLVALIATLVAAPEPAGAHGRGRGHKRPPATLIGWASLPADTFAEGPPSGVRLGTEPRNGRTPPFDSQPVQGFSGISAVGDGTFWVLSDNGFGSIVNSPDYHLRLYRIRPGFETASKEKAWQSWKAWKRSRLPRDLERGDGEIEVLEHIELRDPDHKVPFPIVNHFSEERVLTGADFDLESIQFARDGSLWIGDEFGPFVLHVDAAGKVLEPPIPLPNGELGEHRAPQNPYNEEIATLRTMNAMWGHARAQSAVTDIVASPWHVMLADGDPTTVVGDREEPEAPGEEPSSSEIHDVNQLHNAGYKVVPYTINDPDRMAELLELGVDGLISDRPDLLYQAIADHDADGDGTAGDWILPDGRIGASQIDAQGHRGARNLRPENTLPAMEVALDHLMTTLETDTGITSDGVPVLNHDPFIGASKCRHADGSPYGKDDEVLVKDLTAAEIQSMFVCDGLIRGEPQTNDPALSPVTAAFAAEQGLDHMYVMPTLDQLFAFVDFYAEWYTTGPGATESDAAVKAANAAEVRFNIETKRNPRPEAVDRTVGPEKFVEAVAGTITAAERTDRADIQSFDWSTLLEVHRSYPDIRTVALYGDFSTASGSDGTNLEPDSSAQTPWLGGLTWPYRVTQLTHPLDVQSTGGFEGMAQSPNGRTLYPMLEKPLPGDGAALRIFELDVRTASYTGKSWTYELNDRATAIGDFIMFGRNRGLVIERDNSQGELGGFKAIYEVKLPRGGGEARKTLAVDLLDIANPYGISLPGQERDVGVGDPFAFPFVTIEDVIVFDRHTIGVLNDNNYPNSVGRHVGAGEPDDNEFIVLKLDRALGSKRR